MLNKTVQMSAFDIESDREHCSQGVTSINSQSCAILPTEYI